ncbi:MAG TPA: patatin-like phospholipase family protein [Desulfomonilia bacterium]
MKRKEIICLILCAVMISASACSLIRTPPKTPVVEVIPPKPAKIALVLGAGAAKGFAHIGVLKVLEANKVPIDFIIGTSAGSVVGAFYAYGYKAYDLQALSMKIEKSDVVDLTIPKNGFIKGEKLENFINKSLGNTPIEKFKIKFYTVSTDLASGKEVVFASGNAGKAVRASSSIPGIFQPVSISGRTYVDGGVVSPVAVDAARRMGADVVIAVDISGGVGEAVPEGIMDTILQAIDIMYAKISMYQLNNADVVIRPRVGHIGSAELEKRNEAILEGEKAAMAAIPQIQSITDKLRSQGRIQ